MDAFPTARLDVRPLEAGDEGLYVALYGDPAVMAHVGAPLRPDAARRGFVAAREANAAGGWSGRAAVLERRTGAAVGLLALLEDASDPGGAELGVMLLPAAQGHGFALELVAAVLARVFGGPAAAGPGRIWARHAPGHAAAAAVLAAAGLAPGPGLDGAATRVATREGWRARRA